MIRNIVLVGMPGAGKSSLVKRLANHLNLQFVDTDREISSEMLLEIPEIFRIHGEAWFRNKETTTLNKLLSKTGQVIATGGGLPCFNGNMETINKMAFSVYLDLPIETLAFRIMNAKHTRPMFAGKSQTEVIDQLLQLKQNRQRFYLQAHKTITSAEQVFEPDFFR